MKYIAIWDLPVRLFHWAIVVLIGAAWWSAEQGRLDWHRYIGYSILTLLLFRLTWGIFGSTTARFKHFLHKPTRVLAYLRSELPARTASPKPGHNPLGGWSVIAMLAFMLLQALLGLFAVDVDGIESGPLAYLVNFDMGRLAAQTHHIVFNILLSLIGLHLAAIVFYRLYKNERLLATMIFGAKPYSETPKEVLYFAPLLRAAGLLLLSAAIVLVSVQVFGR